MTYPWTDNPTVSGVAQCDTDVLNDCLMYLKEKTDNAVATSDCAEIYPVIETYVSGTSWYRIYSDGWCEQGGIVTNMPWDGTGLQVVFLKEFIDTNYYSSPNASSNVGYVGTCCYSFATKSMYIANRTNDIISCKWEAKGYLASGQYTGGTYKAYKP